MARPGSADILGERRLAEAGVLLVVGFWAGNFVVAKVALGDLPPLAFATLRFSLASFVLLGVLRFREGSVLPARQDVLPLFGIGLVGYAVYQLLWMTGLQTVGAGDSALLIAATPVVTALLAGAMGSDALTPARLTGALIAFAGVAIVVGAGDDLGRNASFVGYALTLAAAVCWAVYTLWAASFLHRESALRITTWAIVFGTLAMLPVGTVQLGSVADPSAAIAASIGAILYSGLLSAGLPNVIVLNAVRLLGPTRVTAFQFLVPAIAVVLAAVFLGEPIRAAQILGGLVIVGGVLLTRRDALMPHRLRRRIGVSSGR